MSVHAKQTPTSFVSSEETNTKLEAKMAELGLKEKEKLVLMKAEELSLPYISFEGVSINHEILGLIPRLKSWEVKAISYARSSTAIHVAAVDPKSKKVMDYAKELADSYGINIEIAIMSEHSFERAFRLYEQIPEIKRSRGRVMITEEDLARYKREIKSVRNLSEMIHRVSMTDVFTVILAAAIKIEASDVHIEPDEKDVVVRFRIDGVLHEVVTLSRDIWKKLVSRVKLLASLKINVNATSQDGRFSIDMKGEKLDVRVAVLPIAHGESVVLRLLYSKNIGTAFEELGISGRALAELMRETQRPNGMILATGPTGSGKTTTLYAIISKLNTGSVKIITLEDPIEYELKGINQSQVDEKKGYTFSEGLKSILRQDPDVVLVGEIRDYDTADTATNAALTGHLVISTLHTNDASGAIPRLMALGVQGFLLAPAINTIIGQRLVRRICEHCKKETELDPIIQARVDALLSDLPQHAKDDLPDKMVFYDSFGCEKCFDTGYKGRIGIFEILSVSGDIEKSIAEKKVTEYEMRKIAKENGMVSMAQDGVLKCLKGITSLSEVFRVTE